MMYAFAKLDAVRSFREAWKRDPDCAICYWGEAWAWGSYLNGPMSAEQSPFAYAAAQKALAMQAKATPKEQALIDAIQPRYVEDFEVKKRVEQDRAYAEAMRKLYQKYPDDLDVGTLYGDALFLLEPRRGTRDVNAPNIQRLHAVLESVLAQGREASRRVPSLRARHGIDRAARQGRGLRQLPRQAASRAPATSITCRRTP